MSFFDAAREKIRQHFEKNSKDRERMEELRKEVNIQRQQIFEEEFKKNALEVAKAQAHKDAAEKSGLQKLRAETRLRRLNEQSSMPQPGSWREKMRDYTAKNIARREENLKRTEGMNAKAEEIRLEREGERNKLRTHSQVKHRGLSTLGSSKPTWKM